MKILELCLFSSGADGVWQRVKNEAKLLSKKNKVLVFSSNIVKGSSDIAKREEQVDGINVMRFKALKLGGESFMYWFNREAQKEAIKFKPDLIIVHSYRHLHTTKAIKIAKKIGSRVLLVTHAPFGREESRSFISNLIVKFYDLIIGRSNINKYHKILRITNWELPYLKSLGANEKNIVYSPNGIKSVFFNGIIKTGGRGLIYTGRISPIKDLKTLILSMKEIEEMLIILGPAERNYLNELNEVILKNNLKNKVKIINKRFDEIEQIKYLDSSEIFILPSKTEGHPQSLIEAMARGKIVIASDNPASRDIIIENKNGFLFPCGDYTALHKKIEFVLKMDIKSKKDIMLNARKTAKAFEWKNLINSLFRQIK
jgi:glycosyltransferase involved in cell wall biosynthesis